MFCKNNCVKDIKSIINKCTLRAYKTFHIIKQKWNTGIILCSGICIIHNPGFFFRSLCLVISFWFFCGFCGFCDTLPLIKILPPK